MSLKTDKRIGEEVVFHDEFGRVRKGVVVDIFPALYNGDTDVLKVQAPPLKQWTNDLQELFCVWGAVAKS